MQKLTQNSAHFSYNHQLMYDNYSKSYHNNNVPFLFQRRRWMQGIFMVVFNNATVHWKTKFFMMSAIFSWLLLPLSTGTIFLHALFPFNSYLYIDFIQTWIGACGTYIYLIGYIRQFPIHR